MYSMGRKNPLAEKNARQVCNKLIDSSWPFAVPFADGQHCLGDTEPSKQVKHPFNNSIVRSLALETV